MADNFDPASQQNSNLPTFSVSEISDALKRTVEDTFSYIRVRGELSGVKVAASGHLYADIKDDKSVLNIICWRGTMSKLSIKPEEGLEVICTGRLSTYAGRSTYQMIIETMELAGEGALLKMLEERKKKLAGEGLFAPERKKKRPFIPKRIGVVTSPTGSVIRDIIHRLKDRFPSHVLVWPARVQGEGAAAEIEAGIRGFNALEDDKRPDLIIVARGGGSLEDLMPFNEENVVRAAAESLIPLISAVGHETDTTLIDLAADLRAPTPTGAAELAVPRRDELLTLTLDHGKRLHGAITRFSNLLQERLNALIRGLKDPLRLLENKTQQFDFLSQKISAVFDRYLQHKRNRLIEMSARIKHPSALLDRANDKLNYLSQSLVKAGSKIIEPLDIKLKSTVRILENLSFERVLERGYSVVLDKNDAPIADADKIKSGDALTLLFKNKKRVSATAGESAPPPKPSNTSNTPKAQKKRTSPKKPSSKDQGSLF